MNKKKEYEELAEVMKRILSSEKQNHLGGGTSNSNIYTSTSNALIKNKSNQALNRIS